MRRDKALLMTSVVSSILAAGVLLYVPLLVGSQDDFSAGLMFLTLLVTGLMAGLPVLASAVAHGWFGLRDRWTPAVASVAAVVAGVLLIAAGGRTGTLVTTAIVLVVVFVGLSPAGSWVASKASGPGSSPGLSGGR